VSVLLYEIARTRRICSSYAGCRYSRKWKKDFIAANPSCTSPARSVARLDNLAGGIVGIGDEVKGNVDRQDIEQAEHFVERGAFVAIGLYQAFVDTGGERYGEDTLSHLYEYAASMQRNPMMYSGLVLDSDC
jgi:hypothetical protein